jgi:hypothetical protein
VRQGGMEREGKWWYCILANKILFSFNNTQFADFNSYFSVLKTYNDDRKAHNVSADTGLVHLSSTDFLSMPM